MNYKTSIVLGILLFAVAVNCAVIKERTSSSAIRSSPTKHLEHLRSERVQQLLNKEKDNKRDPIESIEDVLDAVNEVATQMMECLVVPGMTIGIIVGNETYVMALGSQGNGQLVNVDTNFGIGSTSKAFTSFLAGQLVEQGLLSWNQPIKQYLPKFGMFDPVAEARINIRDMLTHKTGFPDHGYDLGYQVDGSDMTRSEMFYALKYLEPAYDFRSKWEYNNVMIMSAGHVEEEITGKTWEDLVSQNVFTPLDMRRTCADLNCATKKENLAMPYVQIQESPIVREACGYQCNDILLVADPAGGIYSNVRDMAKWVKLHLNTSDVKLVNGQTLTTLHTPQTSLYPSTGYIAFETQDGLVSIDTHSYAYNWVVENYRGARHVWHDGSTIGFNAQVSMLPDFKLGFVALTNVDTVNAQLIELAYYTFDLLMYGNSWVSPSLLCTPSSSEKSQEKPVETRPTSVKASTSSLSNFAGTYQHPFYGKITFEVDESSNELVGTWGKASGNLTYLGDNFFTWLAHDSEFPDLYPGSYLQIPVEFLRNIYGEIDSFTAPFQAEVPSMIFTNEKWIPRGVGFPASN